MKWNDKIINRKEHLFFNDKEILLVVCYDIIMKLSEFSELREDYIADIRTKLGLVLVKVMSTGRICHIFVAFSEYVILF